MKISVVGDIMLDRYWSCSRQQSKKNPENLDGRAYRVFESSILGGAASVASIARSLKAQVVLFGSIGSDEAGAEIERQCRDLGIWFESSVTSDRTTVKTRIVVDGVLSHDRFDVDGQAGRVRLTGDMKESAIIVVQDYRKGAVTQDVMDRIVNANVPVIVDPGLGVDPMFYRGAGVIKCNAREAGGWGITPREAAKRTGAAVIVTRGDKGLSIYRTGEAMVQVQAKPVDKIIDVCGAGDAVAASLAVKMASGCDLDEACEYAVERAAAQIQTIGCVPVDLTFTEV